MVTKMKRRIQNERFFLTISHFSRRVFFNRLLIQWRFRKDSFRLYLFVRSSENNRTDELVFSTYLQFLSMLAHPLILTIIHKKANPINSLVTLLQSNKLNSHTLRSRIHVVKFDYTYAEADKTKHTRRDMYFFTKSYHKHPNTCCKHCNKNSPIGIRRQSKNLKLICKRVYVNYTKTR